MIHASRSKAAVRNVLAGLSIAIALALVFGGASVGNIEVWKILVALIGVFIFRSARERGDSSAESPGHRKPDQ